MQSKTVDYIQLRHSPEDELVRAVHSGDMRDVVTGPLSRAFMDAVSGPLSSAEGTEDLDTSLSDEPLVKRTVERTVTKEVSKPNPDATSSEANVRTNEIFMS